MKVAVLFDNFGPYHLARLAAAGSRMEVLGIEFAGSSQEYEWQRGDVSPLRTVTLFPESSSRTVSTRQFRERLKAELQAYRPDVVAIPGWSGRGAFLALEWCVKNQVPAIVMSESTALDEARSGWREWIKRRYVSLCSAGLGGGRLHEEYIVQLGMAPVNIAQGYDAVDNAYFAHGVDAARQNAMNRVGQDGSRDFLSKTAIKLRSKFSLPDAYFLASARFIPKKNLSRLIEAYDAYRSRAGSSSWDLVLLGDGELRESLETRIKATELSGHVHLPGFVQYPDLPKYYSLAGAFIHASTTEQWGLVVNEAMASGLPVLVSERCGCAPDLVQEDVNGFTFDPTNINQLAELMSRIAAPGFPLEQFGTESQRIVADWGPERFARGLLNAAEMALARPVPKHTIGTRMLLHLLART